MTFVVIIKTCKTLATFVFNHPHTFSKNYLNLVKISPLNAVKLSYNEKKHVKTKLLSVNEGL